MVVTEFYCVLGEAFHALFLIPSKAGRRMRVGKQSPFGSPPLLKTQGLISSPLFSLRRVSAPWGTTRTLAWSERPGLTDRRRNKGNECSLPLQSWCFMHEWPLLPSSMPFRPHCSGVPSTPAHSGGRLKRISSQTPSLPGGLSPSLLTLYLMATFSQAPGTPFLPWTAPI